MSKDHLISQVLDIIASETGVDHDELYDDNEFSDLGLDPILSKLIVDRISDTTGVNLNPTVLLTTCPTVGSLKHHLTTLVPSSSPSTRLNGHSNGSTAKPSAPPPVAKFPTPQQPPLLIRLQGNPQTAQQNLFLLPDGSGTGMAYARIPALGPRICLYGLNSPFLNPSGAAAQTSYSFDRTLEQVARMWIPAIREVQPRGPFLLGGWSAGGYYAFEVAKQLQREGDLVEKLVLIDSPCRLVFEALPMEVVEHLSANKLMGNWGSDKETPEWMVRHFEATIEAVDRYVPTPMRVEGKFTPEVFILWASEGVFREEGQAERSGLDLSVKVTKYLLEGRPDFGPTGWEDLFPGGKLVVAKNGGSHFTVVHEPFVAELASLLRDVLLDDSVDRQNHWKVYKSE